MFDIFYSGKKPGLFAHERAADSIEHAQSLSRTRFFWWVSYLCDYSSWDWFYEPPPWQAHQNHVWPSKWHQYSGTCLISKAPTDQWNFHDEVIATRCVDENWRVLHAINLAQFDFSWHPHPLDPPYIYVWGNQHWPGEKMPTVEYVVDNATERKYMDWPASLLPTATNWTIPVEIDPTSVDYSWVPDPQDPAYIYEFATQWQPNGGAVYTVPGATERKYVEIQHCRLPNKTAFTKLEVVQGFDYSWHPDNTEPPYNYVFGNQHWAGTEMPTLVYAMSGATQEKFVDNVVACLASTMGNWEFGEDIDQAVWDWTWVPNPKDPPFIYVFGNQWNPPEFKASITYRVPGATEVKYMERRTTRLPQPAQFRHNIVVSKFDYSWEPNPFDPPMIYVFGNQWNSAVLEPTVIYNAGGDQIKYVDDIIATVAQDVSAWELLDDIEEFDYSWRPNPTDPPYTYVFGNQWLTPEQRPALQYAVTGATQIKYMEHPQARRRGDHTRFIQHYPVSFDWSWEPDPGSPPYNYVFGNQYYSAEVMPTVEYRMPGATVHKYMDIAAQLLPCHDNHWHTIIDCEWDYTWRPEPGSPAYIYVFGNQWWSAEKMPTVEYHMPGATERKYMPGPVAKLLVDMSKWTIPEYVDTTDMDFSWAPDPGEPAYIYQFATQHQKTGGPQYRMPGATEFKYVDMMRAEVKKEAAPIFEIDHLDGAAGQIPDVAKRVRYFDNYRDTLIRLAKSLVGEYEHVWVCSSICDYSNFDFTWHPETWQSTMLHVFASDKEKFGDTFYMHVPTFAERAEKKALLEWYSVNYVPRKSVPRRPMPVIRHNDATHVEQVKTAQWSGPLALFTINDATVEQPIVSLWRQETKNIVPVGTGASAVVVPRIAVPYIKTQLYDYPTIDKKSHRWQKVDQPMDIVFISYDEPDAEQNWQILSDRFPRAYRVHGVKGMETALETAADVAQTPWYFAVFAKTRLHETFDFSFVPDYMQQPKHYIFDCLNQSNQLQYGHMGVVMYNCNGVRTSNQQKNFGLDYTLSFLHESIPILSCYGEFATTPYHAWRTAFRESAKLSYFENITPSVEGSYRLKIWSTVAQGQHKEWVLKGAADGIKFFNLTNGDLTQLKQSFRWEWLRNYFISQYGNIE